MPDIALEQRLREAIAFAEYRDEPVTLTLVDAKRFLLRIKQENEKGDRLVYRRDEAKSTR